MYRAVILAFALTGIAHAGEAPVRYHNHKGMIVIMRSSAKPINNILDTPLTPPISFTCQSSSGCVVIANAAIVTMYVVHPTTCAYVDGIEATPSCDIYEDPGLRANIRQMAKVAQGSHTIQTRVSSPEAGGTISEWEFDYEIYDQKEK